jgi:hypothetical protein
MALDDAFADCQPDAGAGILAPCVQALENHEQLRAVFGRDADAIVGDRKPPPPGFVRRFDAHARRIVLAELECIADQVLEQLYQLRAVRHHPRQRLRRYPRRRFRQPGQQAARVLQFSASGAVHRYERQSAFRVPTRE